MGIVVSATALFVILSVFSGLRTFSLSFANSTDPDLQITSTIGKSFFLSPEQEKEIAGIKEIDAYSKIAEERVLFYFNEKEQVAILKGADSNFVKVSGMEKQLAGGQWPYPNTTQCVVGWGITAKLSLALMSFNHQLEVFVPKPGKGPIQTPEDAFNKSALLPVGVYSVNDDVDSKYVFCDVTLAQDLLQFKRNQFTALELKLVPGVSEEAVREKLNTIFNNKITIKNRAQLNDSLYKMLNAENLVTYLFCSLVVVLTLFCLAGALIMLILDKKENIKTLYNLGAEVKSLRKIFLYQGIFITVLGAFFGMLIGGIIIYVQQKFRVVMITDKLAWPVEVTFTNIAIVVLTIFILGILASRIASGRVNHKLLENS